MPSWSHVVLEDVHALYGGCLISVSGAGEVYAVVVDPTRRAARYRGKMPAEALRDLERVLAARPPRNTPLPPRMPAPDEGAATLTYTANGSSTIVRRLSNDRDEDFRAVAQFLSDLATVFARNTSPVAEGYWDGVRFMTAN